MKKYFLTGLAILLPLALTLLIVTFFFNLLTEPFLGIVGPFFSYIGFDAISIPFFSNKDVQRFLIQCVVLVLIFLAILAIGMVARWYLVHAVIRIWDKIIHKIPFVNSVYKATQDIIKTVFSTESQSFKQVVLVPFPNESTISIGLVTRENLHISAKESFEKMLAVFVPTTPNPTSGYLLLYKETDVVFLDMSVEDAFKYIISCGVIPSPFNEMKKTHE